MPYKSMKEVNPALKGIKPPITLAQANLIAEWADKIEAAGTAESPWAVAIAQFKRLYKKSIDGKRWVKKKKQADMSEAWDDISWEDRMRRIRESFETVHPRYTKVEAPFTPTDYWIEETRDDHVIVTSGGKAWKVPYEIKGGEIIFAPLDEWTEVIAKQWVEAQMGELIPLADFAAAGDILSVQIARTGTFTEKHGRKVTITEDDLDVYVANFEAGIAEQELPIFQGHPSAATRPEEPAAAWYKRLYTKVVGKLKTLWADIELSDLGCELLEGKLYKYFSPSIDLENLVIKGGGFVNLPAIKGMAAMELSQFLQEAKRMSLIEQVKQALRDLVKREPELLAEFSQEITETGGNDEMTDEERKALEATIRLQVEAEFAEKQQQLADMTETIRAEVRTQVEAEMAEKAKKQAALAEFAQEVTSGEAGLSTPPDELAAALVLLDEDALEAIKPILKAKVVDFSERGHTGAGTQAKKLPEAMADALREFVRGKEKVADAVAMFCTANDLKAADFDLSEFLPAE